MNTTFLRTFLLPLALMGGLNGFSQTYLLQEGFEGFFPPAGWTISAAPSDRADGWIQGPRPGLFSDICVPQGSRTMVSQWATYYSNDTWAFTPSLSLVGGTTYTVSFKQCVQSPSSNKTESLRVTVGSQATIASQTQTLLDLPALTNTSPTSRSATFTPATSGTYHFAFNCYSAANQRYLSIDDISIHSDVAVPDFPAPYCGVTFPQGVEPITRVEFAGIANSSSAALTTPPHENFTGIAGNVTAGRSYPIVVKGNTNGAAYSYVKVYVDWNQNNAFTDAGEEYIIGTLYNSTGTDAMFVSSSLTVPQDATLGTTRMRVIKRGSSHATTPCNASGQGQSEDYTLKVSGVTSVEVRTEDNVPAYITTHGGTLRLVATVYPSTVDQTVTWSIRPGSGNASINSAGLVTAVSNGNVWARAASVVDPSKKDSLQITIISQYVPPTSITVRTLDNVPATIDPSRPTLTLLATITPANASQSVLWSIRPVTGNASINSAGMVTPIGNGTVWVRAKAAANTTLQDSLLLTIAIPHIGVEEEALSNLRMHPNPTHGILTIQGTEALGPCTLTVMDVTGKMVIQQLLANSGSATPIAVDMSFLANGTYVLQLITPRLRHTQKVVKE